MATIRQLQDLVSGESLLNVFESEYSRREMIEKGIKEYNPELHDVANKSTRPDKFRFVPSGELDDKGNDILTLDTVPVSRAPIGLQKYIIGQKSTFTVGGGVEITSNKPDSQVYRDVIRNWDDSKIKFDLINISTRVMSETQCAIVFFGERGKESLDDFKFRYKIWSPSLGDTLLPHFDDETGDMIAFTREYILPGDDAVIKDVYWTNDAGSVILSRYSNDDWIEDFKLPYQSLPIIYWEQKEPETIDSAELIKALEFGFNDFLTQLGYTGEPILFLSGSAIDMPSLGDLGKVLSSADPDGDAKLLQASTAHNAREVSFNWLLKLIFMTNRSAPLDVLTLKELSVDSGEALQRMLIDVYAAATERQEGYFGMGVQRIANWLLKEWKYLRGQEGSDERLTVKFNQFSVKGESERIEVAMKANGGKPVISHETSVGMVGLESDFENIEL